MLIFFLIWLRQRRMGKCNKVYWSSFENNCGGWTKRGWFVMCLWWCVDLTWLRTGDWGWGWTKLPCYLRCGQGGDST